MKTPTLIDRYKEENTETESKTEVDNGGQPLHWATSPGPSPMGTEMGTDPINDFKWYKMVLASTSATANRMLYKVFKTSLWNLQIGFQKQRKSKQRKQLTFNYKQHLDINSKTPSSILSLYKGNYRKAVKQNAE